jgi:hypothetical protein
MRIIILSIFFLVAQRLEAGFFLNPPKGWQCIEDTLQLPSKVLSLYIGHGGTRFAPTIHVSFDPLSQSIDQYYQGARAYHNRIPGCLCQDLGSLSTHCGPAKILKIESPSVYGNVVLLQAYIEHNQKAYVVTGTTLKEEYENFSPFFFQTIQSFTLNPSQAPAGS